MMNPMLELLRKLKKMDIADRLSALSELADRGWTYCYLSNSLWWASGIGLGFYAYCRRSGGWGSYFWSGRPLHYYKTVFGSWSVNHFFVIDNMNLFAQHVKRTKVQSCDIEPAIVEIHRTWLHLSTILVSWLMVIVGFVLYISLLNVISRSSKCLA